MAFLSKLLAAHANDVPATATSATTSSTSTTSPPPSAGPAVSYPSSHRPYRTGTQLDSTIQEEEELNINQASSSKSKSTPPPPPPTSTAGRDLGLIPAIADPTTSRPRLSVKTSQESLASERFAILLSKDLWKPDASSTQCDTLGCPSRFGLLGGSRRHHCRKCGGVFCSSCSSQTTKLLDTSAEDFIIPPFGHDLEYIPTVVARVCDSCYAALNGLRRPSLISLNSSIASSNVPDLVDSPTSSKDTPLPSVASTSSTKPQPQPQERPHMRRAHSYSTDTPSTSTSRPRRKRHHSTRQRPSTANSALAATRTPSPSSTTTSTTQLPQLRPHLGLLETYPLKDSSAMSKRAGAAIWSPKPVCKPYDTMTIKRMAEEADEMERRKNRRPEYELERHGFKVKVNRDYDFQSRTLSGAYRSTAWTPF